ncbi:MAG: HIT domain-containing protein [Gammaproteobacteria bacterium]
MIMIFAWTLLTFLAGLLTGRLLFTDTRPRELLQMKITARGWDANQIAGLFAALVVLKAPRLIPNVILETDKTLVFEHPRPKFKTHYMFVPKKDIKNIGELGTEDMIYITDIFSTLTSIIQSRDLSNYRLWTNGPGKQDVSYLHFHLGTDE